MIKQILDATVITDPWNYLIIENVFNQQELTSIKDAIPVAAALAKSVRPVGSASIDFKLHNAELLAAGMKIETLNIIYDKTEIISNNYISILKKLNNYDSAKEYKITSQFSITHNIWYQIHSDYLGSYNKAMTFVVYLTPDDSTGTILYTGDQKEDFHSIIPWKLNTGMMFAPNEHTWHNFFHYGDTTRATLNFYIKQE